MQSKMSNKLLWATCFLLTTCFIMTTTGMTLPNNVRSTQSSYEVAPECEPGPMQEIYNHAPSGWGPNVSRNLREYILPESTTTILEPSNLCSETTELFMFVLSKVSNFENRQAVRSTWAKHSAVGIPLEDRVKYAFVLGNSDNQTLLEEVTKESEEYKDIIQEYYIDSYNNLTLKVAMSMKWVLSNCQSTKYILKADDDNFVNVPKILRFMDTRSKKTDLLMGNVLTNGSPYRTTSAAAYVPCDMYKYKTYPSFIYGFSYLMSFDVVQKLYETSLDMELVHLEDVYYTGLIAERLGIQHTHDPEFVILYTKRDNYCDLKINKVVNPVVKANMTDAWVEIFSGKCENSVA